MEWKGWTLQCLRLVIRIFESSFGRIPFLGELPIWRLCILFFYQLFLTLLWKETDGNWFPSLELNWPSNCFLSFTPFQLSSYAHTCAHRPPETSRSLWVWLRRVNESSILYERNNNFNIPPMCQIQRFTRRPLILRLPATKGEEEETSLIVTVFTECTACSAPPPLNNVFTQGSS